MAIYAKVDILLKDEQDKTERLLSSGDDDNAPRYWGKGGIDLTAAVMWYDNQNAVRHNPSEELELVTVEFTNGGWATLRMSVNEFEQLLERYGLIKG